MFMGQEQEEASGKERMQMNRKERKNPGEGKMCFPLPF